LLVGYDGLSADVPAVQAMSLFGPPMLELVATVEATAPCAESRAAGFGASMNFSRSAPRAVREKIGERRDATA
jgi:hypothetical protein